MKKNIFILTGILLLTNFCLAQNDTISPLTENQEKTVKRFKISYFHVHGAIQKEVGESVSASDFIKLVPNSEFLSSDFNEYTEDTYYSSAQGNDAFTIFNDYTGFEYVQSANKIGVLNLMMGIELRNKNKNMYRENLLLRFGFSFSRGSSQQGRYYKDVRMRLDTLISNHTSEPVYADSLTTHSYTLDFTSMQFSMDGSLIFRSNPQRKVTFYTGMGGTIGLCFNPKTSISDFNTKGIEYTFPNGSLFYDTRAIAPEPDIFHSNMETNESLNKTFMRYAVYVPIGLEIKACGKSEFWKRIQLFAEQRYGVNIVSLPGLSTSTRASKQVGFGIKYNFI